MFSTYHFFSRSSRSCSAENGCSKYQETHFLDAVYFSNISHYISTWYLRKCLGNDEKLLCSQRRLASCARGSFQTASLMIKSTISCKVFLFWGKFLSHLHASGRHNFSVVRSIDQLRGYKTKMQKLEKLIKPRNVSFKPEKLLKFCVEEAVSSTFLVTPRA